jgi:hypothetical protein
MCVASSQASPIGSLKRAAPHRAVFQIGLQEGAGDDGDGVRGVVGDLADGAVVGVGDVDVAARVGEERGRLEEARLRGADVVVAGIAARVAVARVGSDVSARVDAPDAVGARVGHDPGAVGQLRHASGPLHAAGEGAHGARPGRIGRRHRRRFDLRERGRHRQPDPQLEEVRGHALDALTLRAKVH